MRGRSCTALGLMSCDRNVECVGLAEDGLPSFADERLGRYIITARIAIIELK